MNSQKSVDENTRVYYTELRRSARNDFRRQRDNARSYHQFTKDHPHNTDFVEEQLHNADEIYTLNNRTADRCKIHCPRCHRWSSMGKACRAFGHRPTRQEAEECLWHFYHPRELKQDKFRNDLIHVQLDRIDQRSSSGPVIQKKQIFLLAGDNGVGKTHMVHVLSLMHSQYYYTDEHHNSVFHNKGDALLELDCGTIEAIQGGWAPLYEWVRATIEHHVKKQERPIIVFNDLQHCKKMTVDHIIMPLFSSAGTKIPLFKTSTVQLPAATMIFATMDMGNVGATNHLSLDEIHDRVTSQVISRFGNNFEKHVSVYPFEAWREETYVWALKRALDNLPCSSGSKIRKVSYTSFALAWYAEEVYRMKGSEINNGRKVADYFGHEIESKANRVVELYEERARIKKRMDNRFDSTDNGWFGKIFSEVASSTVGAFRAQNQYTLVIEWIPYVHDQPRMYVVEEGKTEDEEGRADL